MMIVYERANIYCKNVSFIVVFMNSLCGVMAKIPDFHPEYLGSNYAIEFHFSIFLPSFPMILNVILLNLKYSIYFITIKAVVWF